MVVPFPVSVHVPDPCVIVRTFEFDDANIPQVTLKLFALSVPDVSVRVAVDAQEKLSWSVYVSVVPTAAFASETFPPKDFVPHVIVLALLMPFTVHALVLLIVIPETSLIFP